jgi:hypothetical protein
MFGGVASAQTQTFNANQLCLHNGGEYFTFGAGWQTYQNNTGMKFYPTHCHWASTNKEGDCSADPNFIYPWKIAGWSWVSMIGPGVIYPTQNIWVYVTWLGKYAQNCNSLPATFVWPRMFCTGQVPHTWFPNFNATLLNPGTPFPPNVFFCPTSVHPSGAPTRDAYDNIFCGAYVGFNIPSTQPYDAWIFSLSWGCDAAQIPFYAWVEPITHDDPLASPITCPSAYGISEYIGGGYGPSPLYHIFSANELDCTGTAGGNKGRSYSWFSWGNANNGWTTVSYYINTCTGVTVELAFCLHVCDIVTIPINQGGPASTFPSNPYAAYNFDVGVGAITPNMNSGLHPIGWVTEDWKCPNKGGFILGAIDPLCVFPTIGPFFKSCSRLPHFWDALTDTMLQASTIVATTHVPAFPYPGCQSGTTCAGVPALLSAGGTWPQKFPVIPPLNCLPIRWCSFNGKAFSASFCATYF